MKNVWRAVVLAAVVGVTGCGPSTKAAGQARPKSANPPTESVSLAPTPLRFDLDRRFWSERDLGASRNANVLAIRAFARRKAAVEAECPAAMGIVAESVPADLDVIAYSAGKRSGMPPHAVEKVFSHLDGMLQLKNAVGYRIRGTQGCHPVVHLVHARDGGVGYNIVLEVDPRDYVVIESEVLSILKSFRLSEGAG